MTSRLSLLPVVLVAVGVMMCGTADALAQTRERANSRSNPSPAAEMPRRERPPQPPVLRSATREQGPAIAVPVGGQALLEVAPGVTRIALGNPRIADISLVGGRQLRVVGLQQGSTDLLIWRGRTVERIRLSVAPRLDGARAQREANPHLGHIGLGSETGRVVLGGNLPDIEAHRSLTDPLRGQDIIDNTRITGETVVAVEVVFVAIQATRLQQLGLNFRALGSTVQVGFFPPGSFAGTSLLGGATAPAFPGFGENNPLVAIGAGAAGVGSPIGSAFNLLIGNAANNVFSAISLLSATNFAQVLARPVLLVRSGEEASFLAGGEVPIPVSSASLGFSSVGIEYRPFGVRLQISATINSARRIVLRVNPEVSELDFANGVIVQGFRIPALRVRNANTTVELGNGQSFMLAGLTFSNTNNILERVPAIGELPVIGPLFSRSLVNGEQLELIIIATPRLVRPVRSENFYRELNERFRTPNTSDLILRRNTPDVAAQHFGLLP